MTIMSGVTIVASLPLLSKTFSNIPNIDFLSKLMLTVPAIVIALFAPIAGLLIHKYGRLKPLYFGIFLFVLGGSSGLFLENFYIILLGRAVLGIGVAFIMTSSTTLIGDYFSETERHKFLSIQGLAVGLGGILFISTGGFLAEIHWSYPFAIYLIPLLFLPLLFKTLYEPSLEHKTTADVELKNDALWPVFVTAFFAMVLFYMLPTQLPYLVINELKGTPSSVGLLISVAMSINAVTSMQYAKIKAKFNYNTIFAFAFSSFGIGLIIISQAHSIAQLYFSVVFMGMGFGLIITNVNAWFLSTVSAKQRGKASGILASSFFLGQFSSPLIFEPIVATAGMQGLFFYVALIAFGTAISIIFYSKVFSKTS